MIMKYLLIPLLVLLLFTTACQNNEEVQPDTPSPTTSTDSTLYFPPINSNTWETTSPESLGWNTQAISSLESYLANSNTKAFILLKNGKIVIEKYFGQNLNNQTFSAISNWYWASAGKTLTAFVVGKAQEENLLNINDKSSKYLGTGWTSLSAAQEDQITVKNQLTMTAGLNDAGTNRDCTDPSCLTYLANPSTRWAYHNAPYTRLDGVIEGASGMTFSNYFNTRLRDKIGMNGFWQKLGFNNVYFSTPRSMARFGLLILNKGKWDDETILADESYYNAMITPSQDINKSYGYLWWLNGQSSFMLPTLQAVFPGSISPNAPAEMICAIGKNGQLINIIPSQNMVVIRMGDNPDESLVPTNFQDELWAKIKEVIQ
ncbi:serine hydrolase [marine bacterium AO1-C]|nr:serine hydrolase [marine bacterium AO1-C]